VRARLRIAFTSRNGTHRELPHRPTPVPRVHDPGRPPRARPGGRGRPRRRRRRVARVHAAASVETAGGAQLGAAMIEARDRQRKRRSWTDSTPSSASPDFAWTQAARRTLSCSRLPADRPQLFNNVGSPPRASPSACRRARSATAEEPRRVCRRGHGPHATRVPRSRCRGSRGLGV